MPRRTVPGWVAGVAAAAASIAGLSVHGNRGVLAQAAVAQLSPAAEWATLLQNKYQVAANVTDVHDMLDGPNARSYAIQWIGGGSGRTELAKSVSPITHVRSGLPPTLTIHGDADPIVPYSHAVRLRDALTKAGVANELHTVTGGGHGNFSPAERTKIFTTIREFLGRHRLL